MFVSGNGTHGSNLSTPARGRGGGEGSRQKGMRTRKTCASLVVLAVVVMDVGCSGGCSGGTDSGSGCCGTG